MDPRAIRANRATWEAIASGFDATRRRPWKAVVDFLAALPAGARVLDAGVGNGRHAAAALDRRLRPVGLDLSRRLLERARARAPGARLAQGCLELPPFRDAGFDAAVCVAAMHHVAGRANRVGAWRELGRVLRPGAPLLASVWSLEQPRFRSVESPAPGSAAPGEPGDALVPWTHHGPGVDRFVHLYRGGELEAEIRDAGLTVERAWQERLGTPEADDNHFALARRATG